MGLFNKNDGGLMDVIRCDESDYLIWKWHPKGSDVATSQKANSIRWGSSLRVREGEVAVFQYTGTQDGNYEYIEGPADRILSTENLPILANIIGLAYDGASPFQAEVYFINTSELKMGYGVPKVNVTNLEDIGLKVPVGARGAIKFRLADYRDYIYRHGPKEINLYQIQEAVRTTIQQEISTVLQRAPEKYGISVLEIEREQDKIRQDSYDRLKPALLDGYGLEITVFDLSAIEVDENSEGYKALSKQYQSGVQTFVNTAGHVMSSFGKKKIYEQKQRAAQAERLGIDIEEKNGVGKTVSNLFNSAVQGIKQITKNAPPPIPAYHVSIGGQQVGPYDAETLTKMIANGEISKNTLVWTNGMKSWEKAGDRIPELFDSEQTLDEAPPPLPPTE